MIKTNDVVELLLEAHKEKKQISFIDSEEFTSEEAFYEVQNEFIRRKIEDNHDEVRGYKISLTNTDLQKVFHTDSPVYGTLTNQTVIEDGVLNKSKLLDPLLETELMFFVTEDIYNFAEPSEILEKTIIAPGFEIPDCRLKNWFPNISVGELIMDNAVTGRVVVGEPKKINSSIPLEDISMTLYLNDEEIAKGHSSFVLENPLNAVIWLNNKLSSQGKSLKKGMVISSGTFINPVPLKAGTYRVAFEHFGEVKLDVIE